MLNILAVPHCRQEAKTGCLPACVQMVLAYQGIDRSQANLAQLFGTHPQAGTPYSRIVRLRSTEINVAYQKAIELGDIANWLARDLPIITFVQMRELPYWHGHWCQHAVVVVGLDQSTIYLLDPAADAQVIAVPCDDFMLAWEELDLAYAIVARRDAYK